MKNTLLFFMVLMYILLCTTETNAQQAGGIAGTDIRPFALSGSIGLLSEAYTVSGIEARRPPGMGQLSVNTTFSVFGMRSAFNMLYSTDDDRLRQSMNRFYFQGSWKWLSLAAGTVGPSFSKYSLSGVTVTGGLMEINPGPFSLSLTGGRTRRAVEFSDEIGFREPAYERWLYAARIGFGHRGGNEFALTGVYSYDVLDSVIDPGDALPAENISLTPELNFSFFRGAFVLGSNITVSAFTRDRRSDELDLEDISVPTFLTNIFTPRTGTRIDFAGELSTRFTIGPFRLAAGYERIQPGFRSLGLGQVRSDQESIRIRPQIRLVRGRVNIAGMYSTGRNNLLDTRISTLRRQQLGGNSMLRLTQSLNVSLSYMQMTNENKPVDNTLPQTTELHQKQISQNFMVTPTLVLRSNLTSHTISVNTSYQILDDKSLAVLSGERAPVDFDNIGLGVNYGIALPTGLSLGIGGNLMQTNTETTKSMGNSVNASTGYSFFERKLTLNLNLGWSRNGTEYVQIIEEDQQQPLPSVRPLSRVYRPAHTNDDILEGEFKVRQWSQQYTINLSAAYRLPQGNPIRLTIRGLTSKPSGGNGQDFNELRASLRYEHRF